jgi:hypothetical protein
VATLSASESDFGRQDGAPSRSSTVPDWQFTRLLLRLTCRILSYKMSYNSRL